MGVLKYISALLLLISCAQSQNNKQQKASLRDSTPVKKFIVPAPTGNISDFEKVFTFEQLTNLDSFIIHHEKETSNQIAIVSVKVDTSNIKDLDDFKEMSLAYMNKWGVGQKGKNNGVGIVFSITLRMIRIEVGKGLEEALTNDESQKIIDSIIVPLFRNGDFYEGVRNGLLAIISEIK